MINDHSLWYIGLAILSLFLFLYTYIKVKNNRIFLLLLAIIGLGYLIEAVIYNLLHSYWYYPHILKHDSTFDSNMGAMASNALALPIVATFIALFKKGWIWKLLFVGIFAGIEWLFLHLSIYSHNWWRIWFTSSGLFFFYFPIAKRLAYWLEIPQKGFLHFFLVFLIMGPLFGSFHILPIMFLGNRYYELGWYGNFSQDTNALAAIYYVISSALISVLAILHWKPNWMNYAFSILFYTCVTLILKMTGILHSQKWWDPLYYIIFPTLLFIVAVKISQKVKEGDDFSK